MAAEKPPLDEAAAEATADAPLAEEAAGPGVATTGATVLGGSAWSLAGRIVPQAYVLVVSVAAARFLGPDGLGRQSFIAFVEISVLSLLAQGFSIAMARFVGDSLGRGRPDALRGLIRWGVRLQAVVALFGAAALVLVAAAGGEPTAAWVLAGVACGLGILHTLPIALLIGMQRWRRASIAGLVNGCVGTIAVVFVLAAGWGVTGMFAVEAAVGLANLVWTALLARRALREISPGVDSARDMRRPLLGYATAATYGIVLTLIVWRRSEFFLLERFSTDAEIALYSVAFALVAALIQFPDAIAGAAFPAFATLSGAGEHERIRIGFGRGTRLVLLAALPLTAAALALGPPLVRLLYGTGFEGTAPVLAILILPLPLIAVLQLSKSLLAALGLLRYQLTAETIAAGLTIGLGLALIPPYGAVGAAISNVSAQGFAAAAILLRTRRRIGRVDWGPPIVLRIVVASATAGLAAWGLVLLLGDAAGLVAGTIAGVTVFFAASAALGIIRGDDAAWLEAQAGRRLGGAVGRASRLLSRDSSRAAE